MTNEEKQDLIGHYLRTPERSYRLMEAMLAPVGSKVNRAPEWKVRLYGMKWRAKNAVVQAARRIHAMYFRLRYGMDPGSALMLQIVHQVVEEHNAERRREETSDPR